MNAVLIPLKSEVGLGGAVPRAGPQFALQPYSLVVIDGRKFQVERRIAGGLWQFQALDNGVAPFLSDSQLAAMMKNGTFYVAGESGVRIYERRKKPGTAFNPFRHDLSHAPKEDDAGADGPIKSGSSARVFSKKLLEDVGRGY